MNSSATHHLTPYVDNLSDRKNYIGPNDITIGSGKIISISYIGDSLCSSHNSLFSLRDIFHVPDACSNLLFVSSFTNANQVSVEFFPFYFEIKDSPQGN